VRTQHYTSDHLKTEILVGIGQQYQKSGFWRIKAVIYTLSIGAKINDLERPLKGHYANSLSLPILLDLYLS